MSSALKLNELVDNIHLEETVPQIFLLRAYFLFNVKKRETFYYFLQLNVLDSMKSKLETK